MADMSGPVHVWGGHLDETAFCHVDSFGCFDAGPEFPDQDEVEDQIREGAEEGRTSGGYHWSRG